MSRQFLYALNGGNMGHFRKFIDELPYEPRISWYPSAADDFRPLIYMHEKFYKKNPSPIPEPGPPDFFLFTDRYGFFDVNQPILHEDKKTKISIELKEELPNLNCELHEEIAGTDRTELTDRAIYFYVKIDSNNFGTYYRHMVYCFTENEDFYCRKIYPNRTHISHLFHIRYGGGFSIGHAHGGWLLYILDKVNCEVLITDGRHRWGTGDVFAFEMIKKVENTNISLSDIINSYWCDSNLGLKNSQVKLVKIRDQRKGWDTLRIGEPYYYVLGDDAWVKDGHVSWFLVKKKSKHELDFYY